MIIEKTYNLLKTKYKHQIENLTITDVRVGLFLTVVRLSDNSCGIASTCADNHPVCVKEKRDFSDFSPLKIRGQKVCDLFDLEKESGIIFTLKIAALNAISSNIILSSNYKILYNTDPIELIDLGSKKTITIVGAFQSYIRKISGTGNRLYVLELNENAILQEQKQFFVPANDYQKVLPESDIVIITGLTLVNNTIDNLLSAVSEKTLVIVTGPSSSIIPDILFENKVRIIGATRITKPKLAFKVVSEAGTGFHLFKYCAEKISVLRNDGK